MAHKTVGLPALLLCFAAILVLGVWAKSADGVAEAAPGAAEVPAGGGGAAAKRPPFIQLKPQESWLLELCAIAFLAAFLVNMMVGRSRNEKLAVAWTTELVAVDGVLDRNFSLLGPGDTNAGEVLLKESMHTFQLWASGRRFCQGMLATFSLVRRQDLLAYALQAARGQRDNLELEVRMNEGAMPPLVLAIAPSATARLMLQESADIKALCKRLEPTRDRIANWPDKLVVLAEHSSVFYDLMAPPLLDLVFGRDAFLPLRKYFRFLHITSDLPEEEGPHKQVVRLSFSLPPREDIATLEKFVRAALLLTDLLGSYRLSPEQLKRATEARQRKEVEERQGTLDERQRRAEEKRQQKEKEEQERLKRLNPEQREKELERRQKLQMKRRMQKMSKRM